MSGYGSFAYFYDRLTENVDYRAYAEQIDRWVTQFGGRKGILLDVACGTGSLCMELARLGYDVIGTDSSEDMLNSALDKKYDSGLDIQYLRQDMRSLDMYGTIDVTVCTLDSVNHLSDETDALKAFKCVSLFAFPDGMFIFDVNTLRKHRDVLADNAFVFSLDGLFCTWQNEYDKTDSSVHIWLDFFEEDGKVWRRYSEDFKEIYIPPERIERMLDEAGFEILGVFDGYSGEPRNDMSERAVYVCRKIPPESKE